MKRLGIALILAAMTICPAAMATVQTINASGTTFSPSSPTIAAGDTVRWVNISGGHTVTSGTGSGDPEVGVLFDAPLNFLNTTFEFVFTSPGVFPYFCVPHEFFGMNGTIMVTSANNIPEARDTSLSTAEEVAVNGQMHGFDPDGDPLAFIVTNGPFNGSLTAFNNATGEFTYDPDLDYNGDDSVIFVADDGLDLSGPGVVRLTVTPINDPDHR